MDDMQKEKESHFIISECHISRETKKLNYFTTPDSTDKSMDWLPDSFKFQL